jgi:hypothetical protein
VLGQAQGAAFTYQGYLRHSGTPVNTDYDFQFSLWTNASGGSQVGSAQTVTNVPVQNGLFTVTLDFGAVWDGSDRFLQIAVRPAGVGSYTTLSPRVKINPTPYAIRANTAGTANPIGAAGGDLSGSYPNPTVARLQGRAVSATVPGDGQVLKWNAATNAWLPAADLRDAFWQASGSDIFYTAGKVGIRTNLPNSPLTIQGSGGNSEWLQFRNSAGTNKWHFNNLNGGLNIAESGVADARVFLASGGNVGIGTSTPTAKLHVNGNIRVNGDIRVADDASIFGLNRIVGFNDLRLAGDDNPPGSTDLYIGSDGKIGHRFTYNNVNFTIQNAGFERALLVERADGGNLFFVNDNGTLFALFVRNIGDHRNMQWNQSTGEIGWDTSSRRYKENITPLEDDFAQILFLEPRTYTRIGDDSKRWEIGYIAEEVYDLGLHRLVEYDLEGRPDGVNYEKMVLYLNEVIKQQQARIAALEQRLEQLEARKTNQK